MAQERKYYIEVVLVLLINISLFNSLPIPTVSKARMPSMQGGSVLGVLEAL